MLQIVHAGTAIDLAYGLAGVAVVAASGRSGGAGVKGGCASKAAASSASVGVSPDVALCVAYPDARERECGGAACWAAGSLPDPLEHATDITANARPTA